MFKLCDLRTNNFVNPLGIDVKAPYFSWIIECSLFNVKQRSYQIQTSQTSNFDVIEWESGEVFSNSSTHIKYLGNCLEAFKKVYWRVKVSCFVGNEIVYGDWSNISSFEYGPGDSSGWFGAKFITAVKPEGKSISEGHFFRRIFKLDSEQSIVSAKLYASALGLYRVWINGKALDEIVLTPGWTSYNKRLMYQTYDLKNLISEASLQIDAAVGVGWYAGQLAWENNRNIYGTRTAFLALLRIELSDGRVVQYVTDEDWIWTDGPVIESEIYHGEKYDARLEVFSENSEIELGTDILQSKPDKQAKSCSKWNNVWIVEHSLENMIAQQNEPVRRQVMINVKEVIKTSDGGTVLDFGQNLTGWIKFKVKGKCGDKVVLKHAEVLDSDGNFYTENLRSAKQQIEYILRGDDNETYEPLFTFQGFRYALVCEHPGEIIPENFVAVVVHSDVEMTGKFECSDPLVNRLWENICWGFRGNFVDVPTDCPQRDERLGWTGDAQVFCNTANFIANGEKFYEKWLGDLAVDQYENGAVPYVIPHVLGENFHSSSGWGDAAVICPWNNYVSFGNIDLLRAQYGSMKKWVSYIREISENETMWIKGNHFGDWLALDASAGSYFGSTPNEFISTAYYANSVRLLVKAAKVLGYFEDVEIYEELLKRIILAFRDEFVTKTGRIAANNQTSHVLAIVFDMLDDISFERAGRKLVELIESAGFHLTTGFLGTAGLNFALTASNRSDIAYRLLLQKDYPSWLYPVTKGATTIWEHWDGIKTDGSFWSKDMNSFNHYAYGAIGEWMVRVAGGLRPDEECPGYKRFFVEPTPDMTGGITFIKVQYKSPLGVICINWEIVDGVFILKVTVPPNSSALVKVPFSDKIVEIGSGDYDFSIELPAN